MGFQELGDHSKGWTAAAGVCGRVNLVSFGLGFLFGFLSRRGAWS